MCRDKNFFHEFTKLEVGFVSFGVDSKVTIKGHGTIQQVGEIRNIYYVFELESNILSVG